MLASFIRAVLLASLCVATAWAAGEKRDFRLPKVIEMESGSSKLFLGSLSQDPQQVVITLAVVTPALRLSAWSEEEWKSCKLRAFVDRKVQEVQCTHVEFSTQQGASPTGTPMRLEIVKATFPWGTVNMDIHTLGFVDLRIAEGQTMGIDLTTAIRSEPMDWAKLPETLPLDIEVRATQEKAAVFPMHVRALKHTAEGLEMVVAFENAHRAAIGWRGVLSGLHARLITSKGLVFAPTAVADTIKATVLPTTSYLASGFVNEGWIRFPMLNAEDARELTLRMPSYRPLKLIFDDSAKTWKPVHIKESEWAKVDALLEKERLFTSFRSFVDALFKQAAAGNEVAFLQGFSSKLQGEQRAFMEGLRRVPVKELRAEMMLGDDIELDDGHMVREVKGVLRFKIEGLPEGSEFTCDFSTKASRSHSSGAWTITGLRYTHNTPFWQVGYTSHASTPHFMVFHLGDRDGQKQATLTGEDLERAYASLSSKGLKLRDRYAAFAVTRKEDFLPLTSRPADSYSGVASNRPSMLGGRLVSLNQAIFINDPRFSFLERLMKRQDHMETVLHELTHLAFADKATPWTPVWLIEGLAMHYADQMQPDDERELRLLMTPGLTLKNISIVPFPGYGNSSYASMKAQYLLSGRTVNWLIKRFGEPVVKRFHDSFHESPPSEWQNYRGPKDDEKLASARLRETRSLVKKFFGMTLDELDAQVKADLR